MATLSVRLENQQKQDFYDSAKELGLEPSTIIRLFIDKFIEDKKIVKLNIDGNIMTQIMQIGENSFSEVWDNNQDDIYSKLYKNA